MKRGEQEHYYMRDKKNHYREKAEQIKITLIKKNENKIKNEKKYGKYASLIIEGENDRINGDAPQVLQDEERQISYSYGYFERGSRVLEGKFAKGVFTEEEQENFGILDYLHNVPDKYLKNLKEYPSYLYGRIFQMGKSGYDFTLENGISYEEYVSTMELIYPEVKSAAFKDGYNARKIEITSLAENTKSIHK